MVLVVVAAGGGWWVGTLAPDPVALADLDVGTCLEHGPQGLGAGAWEIRHLGPVVTCDVPHEIEIVGIEPIELSDAEFREASDFGYFSHGAEQRARDLCRREVREYLGMDVDELPAAMLDFIPPRAREYERGTRTVVCWISVLDVDHPEWNPRSGQPRKQLTEPLQDYFARVAG